MILAQYFHYQINSTLYPSLANFRHAIKFIMYDVHCTSQLKFPFCYKIHSRECAECYLHCQKMINGRGREYLPHICLFAAPNQTLLTPMIFDKEHCHRQSVTFHHFFLGNFHLFGNIHSFSQAYGSPPQLSPTTWCGAPP